MAAGFLNVALCLCRNQPAGGYYARIAVNGKEVRRSLRTRDRAEPTCNPVDLQRQLIRTAVTTAEARSHQEGRDTDTRADDT